MVIVVEPSLKEINLFLFTKGNKAPVVLPFLKMDQLFDEGELKKMVYTYAPDCKIRAIAVKAYFGGDIFNGPQFVDDKFFQKISGLVPFFPIYVLFITRLLKLLKSEFRNVSVIVFFETSFFAQLPAQERYYALPYDFHLSSGFKKWGFHGINHSMNGELAKSNKKVISVVLDKQTTVCAILNMKPYSISLGCTPLEGVMSRTCCGDIDAGLIFYLMKKENISTHKLDSLLKNESGFLGMTGYDLTLKEMLKLHGRDKKVTLAFDVYQAQILKHMAEGMAALGGVDEIIFSGKDCEVLLPVVFNLLKRISFLGITLKNIPWNGASKTETITCEGSCLRARINHNSPAQAIFFRALQLLKRQKGRS